MKARSGRPPARPAGPEWVPPYRRNTGPVSAQILFDRMLGQSQPDKLIIKSRKVNAGERYEEREHYWFNCLDFGPIPGALNYIVSIHEAGCDRSTAREFLRRWPEQKPRWVAMHRLLGKRAHSLQRRQQILQAIRTIPIPRNSLSFSTISVPCVGSLNLFDARHGIEYKDKLVKSPLN